MSKVPTRWYLCEFTDGDHAWSEGIDGMEAARLASVRWGVAVRRYQLPGLALAWVVVS